MPGRAQTRTTMACTVLSTIAVDAVSTPGTDHRVKTRAFTTSPPMVATGSSVLTDAPIHDAAKVRATAGRRAAGNSRRHASAPSS